jgi:hypothetical protein
VCGAARPVGAQGAPRYDTGQLNGATFSEVLRSEVRTAAGTAERVRNVVRNATYSITMRRDTLVVTADTLWLSETADGVTRAIDVDPVIGARWKLMLDSRGAVDVTDQPVMTRDIADVSDVSIAMDDFFPPAPPRLGVRGSARDSTQRLWRRLADSAGSQRYHVTRQQHNQTRQSLADTVAVTSTEEVTEDTDLVWEAVRGPMAWTRHIVSVLTSRYAGRTMRATADQYIVVGRLR